MTCCNPIGQSSCPCRNVMSGQVLAVFSGVFASLASVFSKLALSSDVHALDRHVLSTFCTTENNDDCFPVRAWDVNFSRYIIIDACMLHVGKARNMPSCTLYPPPPHTLMCAGVCPAPRGDAVSHAWQQWSNAAYLCQGHAAM